MPRGRAGGQRSTRSKESYTGRRISAWERSGVRGNGRGKETGGEGESENGSKTDRQTERGR